MLVGHRALRRFREGDSGLAETQQKAREAVRPGTGKRLAGLDFDWSEQGHRLGGFPPSRQQLPKPNGLRVGERIPLAPVPRAIFFPSRPLLGEGPATVVPYDRYRSTVYFRQD
jgi:hypothetical protein